MRTAIAAEDSGSSSHVDTASRIRSAGKESGRGARETIENIVIALAGLSGVIAILIAMGPLVGWNSVRLATGSMSPELPTDSLLLTHTVPADQVSIGDVVMVQREAALPVTHRVVAVATSTDGGTARLLTLKGDANPAPDAQLYDVETAGLVVVGLPWGGQVVTLLRSPWVLGMITVVATAAIVWGLWPKRRAPRHSVVVT